MAEILLGAHEGGLREEGPVVIAACILFAVGLPGHVGLFVTPNALFTGPQRERLAAQVEVRELLSAAVNVIVGLSCQAQPDTVVVGGIVFELQRQTACFIDAHQQRRAHRVATGKANGPARVLLCDGRVRQGNLFVKLVLDTEIATKHVDIGNASTDPQAGGIRGVGQNQSVFPVQGETTFVIFQFNIV